MILKKGILRVIFGFIFILLITCGVYLYFKKAIEKEEGSYASGAKVGTDEKEEAPLPVKVIPARIGELVMRLKIIGEAEALRLVKVKSELKGDIKRLLVDEGSYVKEGNILLELDDMEYRLRLEEAEVNRLEKLSRFYIQNQSGEGVPNLSSEGSKKIESKKESYERALKLWKEGLVSDKDLEKAKREYELSIIESGEKREDVLSASTGFSQADLAYKQAKMNLEKTRIKAPFSGVVTDIKVREGQSVNPGEELMTLVNLSSIRVTAKVLESEIEKIEVGRRVFLRFFSYSEKRFYGRVRSISPVVNPQDKTCNVFIDVENPQEMVKPGMHCEVAIDSEIHRGRLVVPKEAILIRGGRKLCFVVEGELAKWRYVETGLENDEFIEILSGISEGEKVIVEGHFTLAHDAKIRITNNQVPRSK